MGFNTTVVVHNDSIHVIKEDPEFGKNLAEAIEHLSVAQHHDEGAVIDVHSQNHANAAEVIEQHHADIIQLVAVGANTAWVLPGSVLRMTHFDAEVMKQDILKDFADKMGFRLVKKTEKTGNKEMLIKRLQQQLSSNRHDAKIVDRIKKEIKKLEGL